MHSFSLEQEIEKFPNIGLEAIERVALMDRVDTKFAFDASFLPILMPFLLENFRILQIGNARLMHYENVYFDTPNFNFYKAHHDRRQTRHKIRTRKYVETNVCFLEIKKRSKGKTLKQRMLSDTMTLTPEHLSFVKLGLGELPDLEPKLYNSFQRITLVNHEMTERLTFDFKISFSKEKQEKTMDGLVIAELKQSTLSRDSPFYLFMKNHGIRPHSISKYCLGIVTLYGKESVKTNAFKDNLRYLHHIHTFNS